jgi:transcriptional regulator with XRE-family HTH domain
MASVFTPKDERMTKAAVSKEPGRTASTLGVVVSQNIKRVRRQRGISLTELARQAGVARATLHQLEAGTGNPTLETLNSIATLLGVTLGDLVTDLQPADSHLIRSSEARVLNSPGVESRIMRRFNPGGSIIEVHHIQFQPQHTLTSPGHQPGVIEHILVQAGRLTAGPSEALEILETGDFMTYRGDLAHSYSTDDLPALATLLMQYPIDSTSAV